MSDSAQQLSVSDVLQLTSFRRLWVGQLVSMLGDFLLLFTVLAVATYKFHGTPSQVTMVSVSFMLPIAVVGPLAGVFIDRWDQRRTMIFSDLIRAVIVLCLLLTSNLPGIYALLLTMSVVSAFFIPAQSVMLRTVVPINGLLSANGLMQQAMQSVRIITPFLAGILIALFGEKPVYVFESATFLFSAAMIAGIVIEPQPSAPAALQRRNISAVFTELIAGVRFIFTHAGISFVVISVTAGMFAISSFGPLIAVYVRDLLHAQERTFGFINMQIGIGMIAGTLCINRFAQARSKSRLVIEGLLCIGLSVVIMATFISIPVAALANFGVGVGAAFVMVPSQALIQQETPMELVGRVSSSVWSLISIAQLFGLVLSGAAAQRIGLIRIFYASAVLLVLIAVIGHFQLAKKSDNSSAAAPGF